VKTKKNAEARRPKAAVGQPPTGRHKRSTLEKSRGATGANRGVENHKSPATGRMGNS